MMASNPKVKKISAINSMNPPTSQKYVQQFVGVVNCYCDMWPKMSHTLAPLTRISYNNSKLKCTKVEK